MTDAAQNWEPLNDAELTSMFGSSKTGTSWGSLLNYQASGGLNNAPAITIEGAATNATIPGMCYKDKLPTGGQTHIRLWGYFKRVESSPVTPILRVGIIQYDEDGNYAGNVYEEFVDTDIGTGYTAVDVVLAVGANAFVKPFAYSMDTSASCNYWVGLLDMEFTPPKFKVAPSDATPADGTYPFDTEVYDYGDCYDHTTKTFTAPVAGVYLFSLYGPRYVIDALPVGFYAKWTLEIPGIGSLVMGTDVEATTAYEHPTWYWRRVASLCAYLNAGGTAKMLFNVSGATPTYFSPIWFEGVRV